VKAHIETAFTVNIHLRCIWSKSRPKQKVKIEAAFMRLKWVKAERVRDRGKQEICLEDYITGDGFEKW